jgi:hypothetical protein
MVLWAMSFCKMVWILTGPSPLMRVRRGSRSDYVSYLRSCWGAVGGWTLFAAGWQRTFISLIGPICVSRSEVSEHRTQLQLLLKTLDR